MKNVVLSILFIVSIASTRAQSFARGADVSWLSEMENSGKVFYNDAGVAQDLLQILQDHCINSIRLRVWVNPANGWCNKADVVTKAKRAKAMGFRIMIDFHYSDTWTDPGTQTKPAAWAAYSTAQLSQAVYDHTYDVLNTLKQEGVTPEWCQIGNETNDGMLWQEGRASVNMANYAQFVTSGNNAAHAVFPNIVSIVHIANGYDADLFKWNIGELINQGAAFDAVGMSLYPETTNWQTLTAQCLTNMTNMVNLYNKSVMICEIGMYWDYPTESKAFVEDIIAKTQSLPYNKGLGVFWWEPGSYNWNSYSKGVFDVSGKPTIALDGFQTSCPAQPVKVKFVADLSASPANSEAYITGTMTSDGTNWALLPMKNEGNKIFSIELQLAPRSTGAYYLLNANDWASRESVPASCATWYTTDRGYTIGSRDTTIYVTWANCTTYFDCHGTMNGVAKVDACGVCSGGLTGKAICSKQQITLSKGWNLISTNVRPTDSTIATLFKGLDVLEIKDMNTYWRKGQGDEFNSLKTITAGEGYLVNMNAVGTLIIQGVTLSHPLNAKKETGWQLIGCPYQSATPFSQDFDATNCSAIKNFEGFWMPDKTNNSIQYLESGKGYFVRRK